MVAGHLAALPQAAGAACESIYLDPLPDDSSMSDTGVAQHPAGAFGSCQWSQFRSALGLAVSCGLHSSLELGDRLQISVLRRPPPTATGLPFPAQISSLSLNFQLCFRLQRQRVFQQAPSRSPIFLIFLRHDGRVLFDNSFDDLRVSKSFADSNLVTVVHLENRSVELLTR